MTAMDENRPIYLDFASTTPVAPEVAAVVQFYMTEEYGNAGSRTHLFGTRAKRATECARRQVATCLDADSSEVVFTSGATESNNLAILGLSEFAEAVNRKHIITTAIEHKSVLEPVDHLESCGFEVTRVFPGKSGCVSAQDVLGAVRDDTLLVSVMHANNETGILQPVAEICKELVNRDTVLHVDASQTFGKYNDVLSNERIDLISISGHKLYAPKGIGALIARKARRVVSKLKPLMFGGGQEYGLRPGTIPVPLAAGLGAASESAAASSALWIKRWAEIEDSLQTGLDDCSCDIVGDRNIAIKNIICLSFPGVDAEALFVSLKDSVAISNGSACTSRLRSPSHVLKAMQLDNDMIAGTVRLSLGPNSNEGFIERIRTAVSVLSK